MLRLLPPRGRARRLLLCVVLAVFCFTAPVGAAEDVVLSAPPQVGGRDSLVLELTGVPAALAVAVTDDTGATATWRFGPAGAPRRVLTIDLASPDIGQAPHNGAATVAVHLPIGVVAETTTSIDRDPPAPVLTAVVRNDRVGLLWDAVAAVEPVTYRLERAGADSVWSTLRTSSDVGHTDRDLAPGRYRYRLTAAVPGDDGAPNWSRASAAQVRVAAPVPPPPAPSPAAEPAPRPAPGPRDVAATGHIRRAVEAAGDGRGGRPALTTGTATAPAVDGDAPRLGSGAPAIALPQVDVPLAAGPAPAPSPSATGSATAPFPAAVAPPGSLVVGTATGQPINAAALAAGLIVLLLGAHLAQRLNARRRVTPGPDAPR